MSELVYDVPFSLQSAAIGKDHCAATFKSATLVTDGLGTPARRQLFKQASVWLGEYNLWFLEKVGVHKGHGLHLLYDREISVSGENLFECSTELESLGLIARGHGYAFSITLNTDYLLDHLAQVRKLAEQHALSSVAVCLTESNSIPPAEMLGAIESLVGTGLNVGVIGDVAQMRAWNLFQSNTLSAANMTWYPLRDLRPSGGKLKPVEPCQSRLRLYINGDGQVFPCFGLMGLDEGLLGSIYEPFSSLAIHESAVVSLLQNWETKGPGLESMTVPAELHTLVGVPEICLAHRAALT